MSLVALRKKGGRARPDASAAFLPTTRAEMKARGWDQLDVLLVAE